MGNILSDLLKESEISKMNPEFKYGIPKAIVTGHTEFTEEEKKEIDAETERWLKSKGMIKEDEHLSDFEQDPVTGLVNLNKKKKK